MMITDKEKITDEVVKAKFINDSHVICATSNMIGIFDVRKPQIIVKEFSTSTLIGEDEVNDIDIARKDNGVI